MKSNYPRWQYSKAVDKRQVTGWLRIIARSSVWRVQDPALTLSRLNIICIYSIPLEILPYTCVHQAVTLEQIG